MELSNIGKIIAHFSISRPNSHYLLSTNMFDLSRDITDNIALKIQPREHRQMKQKADK